MDENNKTRNNRIGFRASTKLAAGLLILLYLVFCIFVSNFARQQIANGKYPIITLTASPVLTPRILVRPPEHDWQIQYEGFSSNIHEWTLMFSQGKVELIEGRMILQSYQSNRLVIATTHSQYSDFEPSTGEYFLQADFTTDTEASPTYGLVFGLDRSLGTFYLFEINQQVNRVTLNKYVANSWTELLSVPKAPLHPFPEVNTLSVYFGRGEIELYVNGQLVNTYVDANPLNSKGVGAYIDSSSARLVVDNFFTYDSP